MSRLDRDDLALLSHFGPGAECSRCAEIEARRVAMRESRKPAIDKLHVRAHKVRALPNKDHAAMWQMPNDIPLFQMATVAQAADVPPNTLRAWFQRGHVTLGAGDSKNQINGLPSKFTLSSVRMIAVTAELVRLGVPPKAAFAAAEEWTMFGTVGSEMGDLERRNPGELFPLPMMTYLVVAGEGGAIPQGRSCEVIGIDPGDARAHSRMFNALFARGRASARIVLLNVVDAHVRYVCEQSILGSNAPPPPDWEKVAADMLAQGET